MRDTIRDSFFGQLVRKVNPRLLPYAEEAADFAYPPRCNSITSDNNTLVGSPNPNHAPKSSSHEEKSNNPPTPGQVEQAIHDKEKRDGKPASHPNCEIVDWYGPDDPENPQNWSTGKKLWTTGMIMLLTFAIYIGSAIYTPGIPGVMEDFGVSQVAATLGLSLFVLSYGLGPMILSPITEIPSVGRTAVYIVTLGLFVALNFPAAFAPNFGTLMAMRFLTGFVGSPALATGGASLQDIWAVYNMPYAVIAWSCAAVCGPVLGPIVSGFAVAANGWRWSLFPLLFLSGFAFIVLLFGLPETYAATILYRRAQRLRKITGNQNLRSQSEIDQSNMSPRDILFEALWRPISLMQDFSVSYANIYIGLCYSLFYLFFESFPLVYEGIYHFSLQISTLPFIAILVGCWVAAIGYFFYLYYVDVPNMKAGKNLTPEARLAPGLVGCFFPPVALFIFGWTSREGVHWFWPTLGAGLYIPGVWLLFQSVMSFLPMSYPKYAASVFAGNDLVRSTMAAAFPLFGRALFDKLGLGPGCSLLAGLSILMIPPMFYLYKYGAKLRARSKFAQS